MTIDERMKMIDNKVKADKIKKETEEAENRRKIEECKNKINALQERISNLLEFAWYAEDNGISLANKGYGGHEGYDTGMFFSNGWSHLVGIMNRDYLGISKGGAYGYINFYTDGEEIYGYDCNKKERVEPLLKDMERFIREFDNLESGLYKYVESKCK